MRLRIINNFIHDMSTGTWAACVLVIVIVSRQASGVSSEAAAVLHSAQMTVFWLLCISLFGLALTCGIRTAYWRKEATQEELAEKLRLLWIKHVAFLIVYGLGTVWVWTLL